MQRTLVILKPDCIRKNLIGEVISRFEKAGFKVIAAEMIQASRDQLFHHYETIGQLLSRTNENIFEEVLSYMQSDKVMPLILEGENVIQATRDLAGKTRPREADKGTIRGDLGSQDPNGPIENVIHASANAEEAQQELKLWFPDFNQ